MKRFLTILLVLMAGCQSGSSDPTSSSPSSTPTPEPKEAPVLQTMDQDGQPVDLAKLYEQGPVVVYFYPKADTPGCTAQACSLRDSYQELTDKGVTVVGVSTDDAESQKAFKAKYNLPFILVPDTEKKVLEAFGVSSVAGLSSRQAFLIKGGKIVWHDASASTDKQAEDVLKQL